MMHKTISIPRIENISQEATSFQQAMSSRFTKAHENFHLSDPKETYIIEVNKETKENRHAYVRQGIIPKDTIITRFPKTPNQNKTIFRIPGLQYASDSTERLFFKNGDRFTFQVGTTDDDYPHMDHELVVFMNHDCNANCKFEFDGDTISIVSCQEIQTGAPLTFDYRTTEKTWTRSDTVPACRVLLPNTCFRFSKHVFRDAKKRSRMSACGLFVLPGHHVRGSEKTR